MAQQTGSKGRVLGDYMVGRRIGSGSFSVVWHGRHRVHGTEVAIKEIALERLNKKLQESLLSEIVILKKISHPNIIRLYDIIETSGRIHLVLEYCRGGDLSVYIQRRGTVPEATAKYFMQQLATGLQVLRENSLIHRDLKPQNLLLLTNDEHSVLKIADFGFARSLQPRGLAETLCGSPLYMAPEIMNLQKYDAKADLWSVGAILYQLVTGKTPFTGSNQIQLLQNIMKSIELRFPPGKGDLSFECLDLCQRLLRRNPVERLTFEEFFNHSFLSLNALDKSLRVKKETSARKDSTLLVKSNLMGHTNESLNEDCLPFVFDDEPNATDMNPFSASVSKAPTRVFSFKQEVNEIATNASNCMNIAFGDTIVHKEEENYSRHDSYKSSEVYLKNTETSGDSRRKKGSKGQRVLDSFEFIDQDYVLVSGPPLEESSSLVSASRPCHSASKSGSLPRASTTNTKLSAPVPITGAPIRRGYEFGSLGSNGSAPSGASHGSTDMGDVLEQPSSHCISKIRSLQQCASAIGELVTEKIESGRRLEAFSVQLVVLAIWKQALHICHTEAASAIEGSPSMDIHASRGTTSTSSSRKLLDPHDSHSSNIDFHGPAAVCSLIEREFLLEVGHAEELATDLGLSDGNTEMPDAVETIFQSALALGRYGAVDELMGEMVNAVALYSKAVRLLSFLLVEAPSLTLNPPLSLTPSDRFRLRSYIDILNNRQSYSSSQRMAFLKWEDQPSLSP